MPAPVPTAVVRWIDVALCSGWWLASLRCRLTEKYHAMEKQARQALAQVKATRRQRDAALGKLRQLNLASGAGQQVGASRSEPHPSSSTSSSGEGNLPSSSASGTGCSSGSGGGVGSGIGRVTVSDSGGAGSVDVGRGSGTAGQPRLQGVRSAGDAVAASIKPANKDQVEIERDGGTAEPGKKLVAVKRQRAADELPLERVGSAPPSQRRRERNAGRLRLRKNASRVQYELLPPSASASSTRSGGNPAARPANTAGGIDAIMEAGSAEAEQTKPAFVIADGEQVVLQMGPESVGSVDTDHSDQSHDQQPVRAVEGTAMPVVNRDAQARTQRAVGDQRTPAAHNGSSTQDKLFWCDIDGKPRDPRTGVASENSGSAVVLDLDLDESFAAVSREPSNSDAGKPASSSPTTHRAELADGTAGAVIPPRVPAMKRRRPTAALRAAAAAAAASATRTTDTADKKSDLHGTASHTSIANEAGEHSATTGKNPTGTVDVGKPGAAQDDHSSSRENRDVQSTSANVAPDAAAGQAVSADSTNQGSPLRRPSRSKHSSGHEHKHRRKHKRKHRRHSKHAEKGDARTEKPGPHTPLTATPMVWGGTSGKKSVIDEAQSAAFLTPALSARVPAAQSTAAKTSISDDGWKTATASKAKLPETKPIKMSSIAIQGGLHDSAPVSARMGALIRHDNYTGQYGKRAAELRRAEQSGAGPGTPTRSSHAATTGAALSTPTNGEGTGKVEIGSLDLSPDGPTGYAYEEVTRGAARERLRGFKCQACSRFYKSLALPHEELEDMCQLCTRHRHQFTPPSTPQGYWTGEMPSTYPDEMKE